MTTDTRARPAAPAAIRSQARTEVAALAAAALLGLGLVWLAGFAEAAAVHDIAHDQRHAIAFPCH